MAIKKKWYNIVAPKMFNEKIIGETLAFEPEHLIGRKIDVSLMSLTGDYSRFFVKIALEIEKVDDTQALTRFIGHECMRERIYRMVQRRSRRIDCIQTIETKDKKKMVLKTVFILARRVRTSIKDDARKEALKFIEKAAKKTMFGDFIVMIMTGELQHRLKRDCSKIYPVIDAEVRMSEVVAQEDEKGEVLDEKSIAIAKPKNEIKVKNKKTKPIHVTEENDEASDEIESAPEAL
ncbi:MAG: hypothetical protein V1802_00725 [Candidatus Aenigmatarchaeota archaeon]